MKDTSLTNALFQAEFNTDVQFTDVLYFIHSRLTLSKLAYLLQPREEELLELAEDFELLAKVPVNSLAETIRYHDDLTEQAAIKLIEGLIERKAIAASALYGDIGHYADKYPYSSAVMLKAGDVHKIGILTPHESLPVVKDTNRQFIRIVSSGVHGREPYFTRNPLVPV